MSFGDLPDDILRLIGAHLGLETTWRSLDEVVRDYAALALTSRSAAPIADELAMQIRRHLKLPETLPETLPTRPVVRPIVPKRLDHVRDTVNSSSSMKEIRLAAEACGTKCARSRSETLERIDRAIDARARDIDRLTARRESFDAHAPHNPVRVNPVPLDLRERCLDPQRLTATGARERFLLTDRDLTDLPAVLKSNPLFKTAAPMRLYRVSHLREAATRKYGGIRFQDSQRRKRQERAERTSRAVSDARERRRQTLVEELNARGCSLREDSRLCAVYIHMGQGNAADIADTMAEMAFCHKHTRYRDILGDLISQHREWGFRYDVHDLSREARSQAIDEYIQNGVALHLVPGHVRA